MLPDLAQLAEQGGELAGRVVPLDVVRRLEDARGLVVVVGAEVRQEPGADLPRLADVEDAARWRRACGRRRGDSRRGRARARGAAPGRPTRGRAWGRGLLLAAVAEDGDARVDLVGVRPGGCRRRGTARPRGRRRRARAGSCPSRRCRCGSRGRWCLASRSRPRRIRRTCGQQPSCGRRRRES